MSDYHFDIWTIARDAQIADIMWRDYVESL